MSYVLNVSKTGKSETVRGVISICKNREDAPVKLFCISCCIQFTNIEHKYNNIWNPLYNKFKIISAPKYKN